MHRLLASVRNLPGSDLSQALAAYRGALEVYTRETFPFYHERVEQALDKTEALLRQARSNAR